MAHGRALVAFLAGTTLASLHFSGCEDEREVPLRPTNLFGPEAKVPRDRLPPTTAAFEEKDCRTRVPGRVVQCGTVRVPEVPGSDATIELAVARVFALDESPHPDPIVYLSGGPGGAIIENLDLAFTAFEGLAEMRDFVFVDQRGTGKTIPRLICTERGEIAEALPECFARLSEDSDLDAYRSKPIARDIDAVRRALGYERWNLLGISYGTRVALTLMRDHPQGLRAVILDGVVPLDVDLLGQLGENAQKGFETTFAACAAQPGCARKYPDSMTQLRTVAAQLDREPLDFGNAALDGATFVNILFNLLYSPEALRFVPQIIDDAEAGRFDLFEDVGSALLADDFAFGMHLSVQCAEEMPFTSREIIEQRDSQMFPELVGGLSGRDYADYCKVWQVTAAGPVENEPVSSPIPTLTFAGAFDPVTPPEYSERVHEQLSNSQYVLVANDSHGSSLGPCGASITRAFLDAPAEPGTRTCADNLPAPEFLSARLPKDDEARTVGGRIQMAVERPSPEEISSAKRDLERRILF